MKKIIGFSALVLVIPSSFAFAATAFDILATINLLLAWLIPLLITLAVVYFIWGVIQYTISTDEEAKKGARTKIIMSLVGIFIIVAMWGIIRLVESTLNVSNGPATNLKSGDIPCVPVPGLVTC